VPYLNFLRRESDGSCIYIAALTPPSTVRALPRADGRYAISVVRRSVVEIAVQRYADLPFSALIVGVNRGQQPAFGRTEQEAAERYTRGAIGGD
jgi:hypothetical protein